MKCPKCEHDNLGQTAYCQVCYEIFRKETWPEDRPVAAPIRIDLPRTNSVFETKQFRFLVVFVALAGLSACNRREPAKTQAAIPPPKIIEEADYILCIPADLDEGQKHPLVVLLSPSADAAGMIKFWTPIAHRHQWIVLASKKYQNGAAIEPILGELMEDLKTLKWTYPIDPARIIAGGYSGGAMGSHFLIHEYSDIFSGVIVNTGMIHESLQGVASGYPRNKLAVFLASPTDFRYSQMQQDRKFLESLGWKTTWIEFNGGHVVAPENVYEEGVQWLDQNFIASK